MSVGQAVTALGIHWRPTWINKPYKTINMTPGLKNPENHTYTFHHTLYGPSGKATLQKQ